MLRRLFPLTGQLRDSPRRHLRSDLSAGFTVGVMLVPQGMAYALIAGVPPIYGLYAGLVPLLVYALLGTSRQLAVGPVAIVSLLVAAGVGPLADGDGQRYLELTFLLAAMVGIIQLALGILRFGFITNLLSHPVLAGFTSAAAIIIGASQLRHLLGVDLPRSSEVPEIIAGLWGSLGDVHGITLAVGLGAMALLVAVQRWRRAFPGALAVVVVSTGVVALLGLHRVGVDVVGDVPGGLPAPVLPPLGDGEALLALLPVALTIALVGFMESIAVAKVYASRYGYDVDPDRELTAMGAANLVGAFFRAFPVAGGFSRTAVNAQAGARTALAGLLSAGVVAVTLLLLTDLFRLLPNAALAAIILVAVAGLFNWREALRLWEVDRRDLAMMAVTFGATLGLGIEPGILVGVLASLTALVYETSRPNVAVLGRLPGTETFRGLDRHPGAEKPEGGLVFRMDASLSFANARFFRDRVREHVEAAERLRWLIFDFHPVNRIDSTALHELEMVVDELRARGIEPAFAGVKSAVMDRLRAVALDERVGRERFFLEVADAVREAEGAGELSAVSAADHLEVPER